MLHDKTPEWPGMSASFGAALTRADVRDEVGKALASFADDVLRRELDRLQADLRQAFRLNIPEAVDEKPLRRKDLCSALDEWWARVQRESESECGECKQPTVVRSTSTNGTAATTAPRSPPASPLSLPAALDNVETLTETFEVATPAVSAMSSPWWSPMTAPASPLLGCIDAVRKDWRRSFVENATKANRKIQYLHESQCCETYEINDVMEEAIKALENGIKPHLVEDGLGGTYFVKDRKETFVAVFKPRDEEPLAPNNPKVHAGSLTAGLLGEAQKGLKEGVLVGEAAINEYAAFLVDQASGATLRAGVCPTALVRVANSAFHSATEDRRSAFRSVKDKVGSFQLFAPHDCTSEDMGPSRFPDDQVHRIAVLDIRLCNTDRHAGNILVRAPNGGQVDALVPIDHGYALPGLESLGEATFEWLYWPAAKRPFSQALCDEIRSIDVDEVESLLQKRVPMLRPECLATLRTCTALLKHGVEAGLTAYEIGTLMVRPEDGEDDEPQSALEAMVAESKKQAGAEDGEIPEPAPAERRLQLLDELIAKKCKALAASRTES
eukprot:gb/GFBE01057805.1/.p1 GENE.gb/GFBE01057805.1/~~gb/GFBE01057805.1/.p1  ORF type:complete len:555 (+),score=118.33 gb/GFBE01057805.1/:1-1665(+)